MSQRTRLTLFAALLAGSALPALAADVVIAPPSGGGVVINGPVTLANVPGADAQSATAVCASGSGVLGPCAASSGVPGPQGPAGPMVLSGAGIVGPNGFSGGAHTVSYYVPVLGRERTDVATSPDRAALVWPIDCTLGNLRAAAIGYPYDEFRNYSSVVKLLSDSGSGSGWNDTGLECAVDFMNQSCTSTATAPITAFTRLVASVTHSRSFQQELPTFYVTLTCQP